MSDSHRDRYVSKLLLGFTCLIGFVFLLYICFFEAATEKGDWYWWALAASALICMGIYLCVAAIAHKVKSDFSRRKRSRVTEKPDDF